MSTETQVVRSVPVVPAILTLAWRELVRFFRQRSRVFGAVGQPIIFWLMLSEGFKSVDLGYSYQFPGILAMILLFTAIFTTISVIEDRNEGFLQGVLVSPVPRWAMVFGKVLGGAIIAWLQAILFMALGLLTVGELTPSIDGVVLAMVFMLVLSIALTALGFYLAWWTDSSQGYHGMMSVLLFPMWLLSGAFFAINDGWLSYVVAINPLTYGVAGLRHLLADSKTIEGSWLPSMEVCWIVTIGFTLAMLVIASLVVQTRTKGDRKS